MQKFRRATWEQLVQYIEYGLDRATAAIAVGISEQCLYDWLRKGRDTPDQYPEHAEFYSEVLAADARFEAYHAGNIHAAAESDWKASAHALERRRPKQWARRAVIDTTWEERLAQMGKNPQEVMDIIQAVLTSGLSAQEIVDVIGDGTDPLGSADGISDGPVPEPE